MPANTASTGMNIGELAEQRAVRERLQWFTREKQWINETHLQLCRVPAPTFLEQEREAALRIITASDGVVTPRMVERIAEIIDEEVATGRYEAPVDTETLALAIVRLAEAFIFNDARAGIRGDVDRLREIEAALLRAPSAKP